MKNRSRLGLQDFMCYLSYFLEILEQDQLVRLRFSLKLGSEESSTIKYLLLLLVIILEKVLQLKYQEEQKNKNLFFSSIDLLVCSYVDQTVNQVCLVLASTDDRALGVQNYIKFEVLSQERKEESTKC